MKRGLTILLIASLLTIPLISAFSWRYTAPLNLLENEWAKFGIVFLLLFAGIYTFSNNRMQNPPVSAIVAAGFSLLISIPIMKRGLIEPFLSPGIIDWLVIIAIIIGLALLFYKFGMTKNEYGRRKFSLWKFIILLIILLFLIPFFKDYLPQTWLYGPFGDFLDRIQGLGWIALIIAIILIIITFFWNRNKRRGKYYEEEKYKTLGKQNAGKPGFIRKLFTRTPKTYPGATQAPPGPMGSS